MGASRMSGQERAPSFGRFHPLGNSIVQVLVDIRCGDWVDWGNARFRLCGCEGLVDDDVDVITPSELGDVLEAQWRTDIDNRERQHQLERVFPNNTHAAALRAAPLNHKTSMRAAARQFTSRANRSSDPDGHPD